MRIISAMKLTRLLNARRSRKKKVDKIAILGYIFCMARKKPKIINNDQNSGEVEIDLIEIEKMAEIGLTQKEMAYIKGLCPETITRWKNGNIEISQAIEAGKAKGKKKLFDKIREVALRDEIDANTLPAAKFILNVVHSVNEKKEIEHTGSLVHTIEKKFSEIGEEAIDEIF